MITRMTIVNPGQKNPSWPGPAVENFAVALDIRQTKQASKTSAIINSVSRRANSASQRERGDDGAALLLQDDVTMGVRH